jgi:hypothetical protein
MRIASAKLIRNTSTAAIKNSCVILSMAMLLGSVTTGVAKEKPLSWKAIDEALLRINDAPPKDWEVYRSGKKNDPLLLQLGKRFLLIESHEHKISELNPSTLERKKGEILWRPADKSARLLMTSDWVVDDIGAAFAITVRLDDENITLDLQLPHPPDVGSLPARTPDQPQPHY